MNDVENNIDVTFPVQPQEYADVKAGKLPSGNPILAVAIVSRRGFNPDSRFHLYDPEELFNNSDFFKPDSNLTFDNGVTVKEAMDKNDELRQAFGKMGENAEVEATPAEVQAMAITQSAQLDYLKDTANLTDREKSLFAGVKENLLGLAYWLGDKVDKVRSKWTVLPARQKTSIKVMGSIVTGFLALAGCTERNTQTQAVNITPIISPTVEYSPTPIMTSTETKVPTQTQTSIPTETQTPTEIPRFENLKPLIIEDCIKYNEIHWETLEPDLGILKAKAEAVMNPDPSFYGEYSTYIYGGGSGRMDLEKITISNPKIAYCAYLNQDSHEFLVLGLYMKSDVGNYSEPVPYAIDLSLNRQMPNYIPDKSVFDSNLSLFTNDEKNYKKLINNEVKDLDIYVAYMEGNATDSSVHSNLLWLYNSESAMFQNFLDYRWLGVNGPVYNRLNEKDKSSFMNALKVSSTHLIPTEGLTVDYSQN